MTIEKDRRPRWSRKRWQILAGFCVLLLPPVLFLAMEGPVLYLGRVELYHTVYFPVWRTLEPVLPNEVQIAHFRYRHWWIDLANERR